MHKQFRQVLLLIVKDVFLSVPLTVLVCFPGWTRTPEAEVIYYAKQLADKSLALVDRVNAASALGNPYLGKDDAILSLTAALRQDPDAAVRITAAVALKNRSLNTQKQSLLPLFELGIPILINALDQRQEIDPRVRAKAADALGEIILNAKQYASLPEADESMINHAVVVLLNVLEAKKQEAEVRAMSASALGRVGTATQPIIKPLVDALNNEAENKILRARAADALGFLGAKVVSDSRAIFVLIKAAKENDVGLRSSATFALGAIGADAEPALPTLIDLSKHDAELEVRQTAAYALSGIAFDRRSIAALVSILKNNLEEDKIRTTAASSLRVMAKTFKKALPPDAISVLIDTLKQDDSELRANAAFALESARDAEAQRVVPALSNLLKDKVDWVRNNAADALERVVVGFQDEDKTARRSLKELDQFISDTEKASTALKEAGFRDYDSEIARSLESLRLQRQARLLDQSISWFQTSPLFLGLMYYLPLPLVWLGIFWLRPLWLLKLDRVFAPLQSMELSIPLAGSLKIPLQVLLYLTFFEFFHYKRRVLDAWVSCHFKRAEARFEEDKTVSLHKTRIPIAVALDRNPILIENLISQDLKTAFSGNLSSILILGEGGSGKTSLACEIARWGMLAQKVGLCSHAMIPVLIDHDFNLNAAEGKDNFIQAISRQLQQLIDEETPIPEELLKHLLKKRRVLVVLDGLSEMSEDVQKSIKTKFEDREFSVNALIVTSRISKVAEDIIQGIDFTAKIEPRKLEKASLSSFIENYLKQKNRYDSFGGQEYFNNCLNLTELVGNRGITVLLARLYAEGMAKKKESGSTESLPGNIPDLMLSYLGNLKSKYQSVEIQRDMKKIAWEGLKETYQPGPTRRDDVLSLLSEKDEVAKDKLEHFEKELGLIKILLPNTDLLQITLDPLAEYLAGLYLLEDYKTDENKWRVFLEKIKSKDVAKIRGFLLAVQDCCDYRKNPSPRFTSSKPPDFVLDELERKLSMVVEDGVN